MAKNTISRIYRSHEKHFIKDLKEAKDLDEQRLHKVRVDIKNLRVLMDLKKSLSGNKNGIASINRLLNPLFKRAGDIRSITLNLKLTQPYQSQVLIRYRQHLKPRQQKASNRFLSTLERFDTKRFKKQHQKTLASLSELKEKSVRKGAEEYLRILFAQIRADIFDINDDETLHQIRKRLKSIRNVGTLLNQMDPKHAFTEELEKIERTYDKIGQWHDTIELVASLEKYVEDLDDAEALEKTAPLILALKKKCLLNKRQIEKRLKLDLVM